MQENRGFRTALGAAGIALALASRLVTHQWLVFAVILVGVAAAVIALVVQDRRPHKPNLTILSSPRVRDLRDTLTALSSMGFDIPASEAFGETEQDLLQAVGLPLKGSALANGFQQFASASGGLLTEADRITLQVALQDRELRTVDLLPLLNSQLDPAKGQFFYISEEEDRIVFLTPQQAQALSGRGWRIQAFPASRTAL